MVRSTPVGFGTAGAVRLFGCCFPAMAAALAFMAQASAAELAVALRDTQGKPISHAVVLARTDRATDRSASQSKGLATIEQSGQEFIPDVSVVPLGARVEFPNHDRMRHHVYSFSDAKRFELRLYSGEEVPSIVFDRPGIVALGCNIHDWMEAYAVVTDAPYYAITDATGEAVLAGVPAGSIAVEVWYPGLAAPVPLGEGEYAIDGDRLIAIDLAVIATPVDQSRPDDDPLARLFETQRLADD